MIASDRRRRPQWGRTAKQTGEEAAAVVPVVKETGGWGRTSGREVVRGDRSPERFCRQCHQVCGSKRN